MTISNTPLRVLIIGATSAMAEAVARLYAQEGASLVLLARHQDKLDAIVTDLQARGAGPVVGLPWQAQALDSLAAILDAGWAELGTVDLVLIAHGTLPDQRRTEVDLAYALEHLRLNGESAIACMLQVAARLEAQGSGVLAVIGSVAGDRGRASNYIYGAAKASVETCASGLRNRLFKKGVHVLTIKPGFVATPMTSGLDLPARLTATPQRVAADIQKAVAARRDVLYTPGFWALIMGVIRTIPEAIFKRLSL